MKKKPSPLPQPEPEAPEKHPTATFAEARRRARSILGLGEARIEVVPPVVTKVVLREGVKTRKWRSVKRDKPQGDWKDTHPLADAFDKAEKRFKATINKIKRQEKLRQDQQKGVDRNRAKGQATVEMVLKYAGQPRIAEMGSGMAACIARLTKLSERHIRRILRDNKTDMTEK